MAQHDYDIVDAAPLTVRAELNSMLMAILTTNSGPLEPVADPPDTLKPGMLWWDTDPAPGTLKLLKSTAPNVWAGIPVGVEYLPSLGGTITGNLTVNGTFNNPRYDAWRVSHIGDTAPSQPLAGMKWYDTASTPDVMKVFNGASWVEMANLNSPSYTDLVTISSSTTQAWLDLISNTDVKGERRSLVGSSGDDRFYFWNQVQDPTNGFSAAIVVDAGDLLLARLSHASLIAAINAKQANIGFTPARQTGAYVHHIGGTAPNLYRDGVNQGAINFGAAAGLAMPAARDAMGALGWKKPAVDGAIIASNALVAGTQIVWSPDDVNVGVGTWRNLGGSVAGGVTLKDLQIFQRQA